MEIYPFTCLHIPKGYIVQITKYDYDRYFSIAVRGKSCGTYDAKVKGKYQKERREIYFDINYTCHVC